MAEVKVLVSDFQFLTTQGLTHLLDNHPEFDLLGVVEDQSELLSQVIEKQPEVLILDVNGKDPVMMGTLKRMLELNATHILIITHDESKEHIQRLLDMGIKGIVTKSCSKAEIINAILSVRLSNRFFCNRVLDQVMGQDKQPDGVNCEPADLSPREFEVLQLIVKGKKTFDIASQLHVSVHTINSHRKNILRKLNLKSPTELIVFALEAGIVK